MIGKKITAVIVVLLALGTHHSFAAKLSKGEWYIQLILKSDVGELEDPYNTFGQRKDAAPGFDKLDLTELDQTWDGTYLSVIFYRPDWGTESASYHTDFRPVGPNEGQEWTFEVRSDDPYRDLSLTWTGKRTKMKNMVLVDLEEDVVVPAVVDRVPQVYNFRMTSPVREFAWRVLTDEEYEQVIAQGGGSASALTSSRGADSRRKSGWLPLGWGQGAGDRPASVPLGLPANPFADN